MTPIITSNARLKKITGIFSHLRICLQDYIVYVSNQAWNYKPHEEDGDPGCLSLVALGATVEAEVLEWGQCKDAQLFQLKVAVGVDQLVFFVVQEGERDHGPEDLEITFEFNKELEWHIRNLENNNSGERLPEFS